MGSGSSDVRGDGSVWVGAASCTGALALVAPLPTLLAALATALLLVRRGARWIALGVLLALGLGAWRAHRLVSEHEAARAAVIASGAWPARCTVRGMVVRSPVMLGGGLRVELDAADVRCRDGPSLRGRITIHLPHDAGD